MESENEGEIGLRGAVSVSVSISLSHSRNSFSFFRCVGRRSHNLKW